MKDTKVVLVPSDRLLNRLSALTVSQLVHLQQRLIARIHRACEGGTMFGVDLRTLSIVKPHLYRLYMAMVSEGDRRRERQWDNDSNEVC